jgi:hypothetical protein
MCLISCLIFTPFVSDSAGTLGCLTRDSHTGDIAVAKAKTVTRTAGGLFVRNLGWKRTATGYTQHKFHLGRDEAKARLASLRLEQLWKEVTARWERAGPDPLPAGRHVGTVLVMVPNPAPKSHTTPGSVLPAPHGDRVAVELPADTPAVERPVWDEVTLAVAEAVRKGEPVARVKPPPALAAMRPESWLVGDWLDQLQRDITVIKIELEEADAGQEADGAIQKEGQRLVEMGRWMIHRKAGGETLHAALAAYGKWIEGKYLDAERRVTAWGRTQERHVAFMRKHLPDRPLAALDPHGIDELLDILRLRPVGEDGRAVSVTWCRNVIKQLRHFLRWLNKSAEFTWRCPAGMEMGHVRIPLTPNEKGHLAKPILA